MPRYESLFQPCITVDDDGTVSVDWSDSYVNTVEFDDDNLPGDVTYTSDEADQHSKYLDSLVVDGVSVSAGLRKLADLIESQENQ